MVSLAQILTHTHSLSCLDPVSVPTVYFPNAMEARELGVVHTRTVS